MNEITYPFEFIPSVYGTKLKFCGEEEGRWTVELNVQTPSDASEKRIQLTFVGVTQARINDDLDRKVSGKYLLMQIGNSAWVDCFLDSYVQEFGKNLLPIIKNMQHFIVQGHESSIGILARKVECMVIN